jgi:hypothetical protein
VALPSLWPTRLADGLELEVFYVTRSIDSHDSPLVSTNETPGSPALHCFETAATSADIKFSTTGYYSSTIFESTSNNPSGYSFALEVRGGLPGYRWERYSVQSWVDKFRTGSGSDRVEHSDGLRPATLFTPLRVLR